VRNCCLLKKDTDPGSEQVKNCEYPVQEAESTLVPKAHHVINSYITGSAVELTTSSTCSLCSWKCVLVPNPDFYSSAIQQFTVDVLRTPVTFSHAASGVSPSFSQSMRPVLWLHIYLDLRGKNNVLHFDALFPDQRAVLTRRQKRYPSQNFLITSHPSILEVSSTSLKGKSYRVLKRHFVK